MKERQVYQFGDFSLDATAKVLFREGQPVQLTRKAVETLLVLAENPGQVLTKAEIISAVWKDRVVDEANLAQNIAVVRRALNAGPGNPAHIETFPGRGYRLEGPVSQLVVHSPHVEVPPERVPEPAETAAPHVEYAPVVEAKPRYAWLKAGIGAALLISGAVLLVGLVRRPVTSSEMDFHVSAMTRMPGTEFQPAISPDGSRVAFLSSMPDGSGTPHVWVRSMSEGSPREVSQSTGHYSSPSWSPDGKRLAYLRIGKQSTELLVASPDDRTETRVATLSPPSYGFENRLLSWSPNGNQVVVAYADAPTHPLGLMLISLDSGERKVLTKPAAGFPGDLDPRFSPDGATISFVRCFHRAQHELFTVPVAGGEARQMTRFGKQISSHDWSADGSQILVSSDRIGEFRIWRLNVERGAGSPEPVGIYGDFPIQFSMARGSPSLVYSVLHQDRNIWRLELENNTWRRLVASTAQDASPQYSPDGRQICFRSDRSGDEQLWVSDADGRNATQITHIQENPSVGRWSPDGKAIVFNAPSSRQLYVADFIAGKWNTRKLGATGVHPVFAADGKSIYAGGSKIVRIPVATGAASTVIEQSALSLELSADGKSLFFVRQPSDTSLWRASLENGSIAKVLDGLVPGCTSCWATTREGVYFLGADPESFDKQALYWHEFKTGQDRVVLQYPEPLWPFGSGPFSLSPDGRALLCVRVDPSNSDVMRVEPFR